MSINSISSSFGQLKPYSALGLPNSRFVLDGSGSGIGSGIGSGSGVGFGSTSGISSSGSSTTGSGSVVLAGVSVY